MLMQPVCSTKAKFYTALWRPY